MPLLLSFGMLLCITAQTLWMERTMTDRYRAAEARTLASELLVAAERQRQRDIASSSCNSGPAMQCGAAVDVVGAVASVVPGQARLLDGVRSYRGVDGTVFSELMAPRFGYDGRALDSRAVGRALFEVSGGDPRVGVTDAGVLVNPLGTRSLDVPSGMYTAGSVGSRSR